MPQTTRRRWVGIWQVAEYQNTWIEDECPEITRREFWSVQTHRKRRWRT